MPSVTSVFLEKKNAILKLDALHKKIGPMKNSLTMLKELSDKGMLDKSEADDLISNYKQSIKDIVQEELDKAKKEADITSTGARTEVTNFAKAVIPIIPTVPPVLPVTDPTQGSIASTVENLQVLAQVPGVVSSLLGMIKDFNDF